MTKTVLVAEDDFFIGQMIKLGLEEHGMDVELMVNGARKFTAHVVTTGKKRACQIDKMRPPPGHGSTNDEPRSGS